MCVGGSVEPARRGRGCVGGWRVEMNNIDHEIANSDPAGTIASLSSLDVPAELDADWNVDIREPTVVPPKSCRRSRFVVTSAGSVSLPAALRGGHSGIVSEPPHAPAARTSSSLGP
ncbi:hypothetical protein GCM10012275_61200 [Longimycelium tulufanense]|uniref:Uncharacterized protein n=1 Tax=Longimycelium tulufanense TaxID=907463 RepID=A0A8J3CII3_9PSEU|nr:hypothetical protein GCM10012275_61200 [Longimycelium tulufanense]